MLRIGIEAQRIFRQNRHGMDVVAIEMIRQLQKLDHDNTYYIFVRPGDAPSIAPTENFHIVPLEAVTYADWEQVQLPLAVRRLGLDVLHCTSNTAPLFSPAPVVLTLHDVIFMEQKQARGSRYQQLGHHYRRWNVPRAVRQAARVFTVSHFEETRIEGMLPEARGKLQVNYNGVSEIFRTRWDREACLALRTQYQLPLHYFLFHGNLAEKKNMPRLLQAYDRYRRQNPASALPLVVTEVSQSELWTLLKKLGLGALQPAIHRTGYVDHAQLPGLYQMATAFLYPSLRESFGMPILEAMASGTPVMTANTSAMPEVAGGAALLVDPTDVSEMAAGLYQLHSKDALRFRLTERGRLQAGRFTWRHNAQRALDAYHQVVASASVSTLSNPLMV